MDPMTINDFDASYFVRTYKTLSWLEIFAFVCFFVGWIFSIRKTRATKNVDGKSSLFLLFVVLGSFWGVCYKLFVNLDIRIFAYLAIGSLAFADFWIVQRVKEDKAMKTRREGLVARGSSVDRRKSGSLTTETHSHRRRHSSSRRAHTRESRGDATLQDETSSRHSRSRLSSDESVRSEKKFDVAEPKEPKFADDVEFDS